jgi:hypothetical protein
MQKELSNVKFITINVDTYMDPECWCVSSKQFATDTTEPVGWIVGIPATYIGGQDPTRNPETGHPELFSRFSSVPRCKLQDGAPH